MPHDLWGERKPQRRKPKTVIPLTSAIPFTITDNDCQIFGHPIRSWDLAGCNVCTECGVKIYCPRCIAAHPQDQTAIALLCNRHEEESTVSA